MRSTFAGALVMTLALPLTAAAQPGNTPYYAAPPPAPVVVAPAEPKLNLEIGLIAAGPRGDWEQIEAETSPGFNLQLGATVSPGVSIFGGLRYIRVKYDAEALGLPTDQEIELSHRELRLGVRFTTNVAPSAKLFVEGDVHQGTMAASFEGESDSQSGAGVGVRGGIIFMADRKIGLGVSVGYSSTNIGGDDDGGGGGGGEDFEDAWLSGDAFVSFWF